MFFTGIAVSLMWLAIILGTLASIVLIKVTTLAQPCFPWPSLLHLRGVEVEPAQIGLFMVLVKCSLMLNVSFFRKMKTLGIVGGVAVA